MGVALNLMPAKGQSLVLAGALVSIAADAAVFADCAQAANTVRSEARWH